MKVDKKVESQDSAWQLERQNNVAGRAQAAGKNRHSYGINGDAEDTVNISLAREIRQELSPEERSAKIARLKALVQSGEYKPDVEKVAKAFVDTVDEEVFFARLANRDS